MLAVTAEAGEGKNGHTRQGIAEETSGEREDATAATAGFADGNIAKERNRCLYGQREKIDTRMQEIVIAYKGRGSMGVRQRQLAPACGKRRTSAARGQLSHVPSAPRTESRPVRRSNNRKSARASKRDGPTAC